MHDMRDAVDEIRQQWEKECPELDTTAMATIGRLKRCAALLQPMLESTFARFNLGSWEFDVLATLRRSGRPYCLAPTALFSALMISSGTMTHRMNRLEQRGLVERKVNPEDARSKLVQLTPAGIELVGQAVEEHVKNEERILSALGSKEREQLDYRLIQLLSMLEGMR